MKKFLNRAFNEFKSGWTLTKLPDHILKLEKNIYVKLIKILGPICVFLIFSGIAKQFHKLIFYYIFMFSFLYTLYRIIIVIYSIKQFILDVYAGKLIVRNSPVNPLNTILRSMGSIAKNTVNFTVGTGITYALCYELDEILVQEGKEPYFVPGIQNTIKKIGAEEYASKFLKSLGIKDRINIDTPKSVTDLLEGLDEKGRKDFETQTGESWEEVYEGQKKLQDLLKNINERGDKSVVQSIKDYVEKENSSKK